MLHDAERPLEVMQVDTDSTSVLDLGFGLRFFWPRLRRRQRRFAARACRARRLAAHDSIGVTTVAERVAGQLERLRWIAAPYPPAESVAGTLVPS
ncbi:hypothetical protein [Nannocystis punicea]|uniref:Uncharacterized protein n=1 Tax=Nannocystis punicea TaxID=2995304 RepID=A0ABY7H564_9BACT|nr:hypothetical protein [Nannocystis poenicansa]WAS94406.1 hypothetical protein O0S08_50455 [Nannocystis poenicansa]